MSSPSQIHTALAGLAHPASWDETERLHGDLARHGGVDRLITALAHDESGRMLSLALAWRAHQEEKADPARRIARLQAEAAGLDIRAEPLWVEAAELHGKAAARRLRQEPGLADDLQRRAEAAERFAAALEDEAFRRRLQAGRLQAEGALCATLLQAFAA